MAMEAGDQGRESNNYFVKTFVFSVKEPVQFM